MWTNIVIEAFCFAKEDKNGKYPCGQMAPSTFCLQNGHCPHFAYADSNEREAAVFVPLHLILWDRIKCISEEAYWKLKWHCWDRWFWDKGKFKQYIKNHRGECPAWDKHLEKEEQDFSKWFSKAKSEYSGKKT